MGKSKDGNKVKYGLSHVHYALITETEGKVTYGKPVHLPGAVNLSLEPNGDATEFFADDMIYFNESVNQGYTGELELAMIPDDFRVDVLGCTIDSNGALIENREDKTNDIALLFEFSGNKNPTRHVLYRVTPSRTKVESSTSTTTKEPKTDVLSITVSPAIDTGHIKVKIAKDDTPYNTWYDSVYVPTSTPVPDPEPSPAYEKSEEGF